jgi:hypothetical protein
MALTVEDGTGKTDSDSYVSVADCTTYATARGYTMSGDAEISIIKAMDFIEAQNFKGYKYTDEQALQFPRGNVYIDDYAIGVDEIPTQLINALCEAAMIEDAGAEILPTNERETKREKVDVIEVEYSDGAKSTPSYPKINVHLDKLTVSKQGTTLRI